MNSYILKARLWMYGPMLAAGLIAAGLFIYIYSLSEAANPIEEDPYPYGPPSSLKSFPSLRDAYLKANGGESSLAALKSVRYSGVLESGDQRIPYISIKRRPWKSLLSLDLDGYAVRFGVDGDRVWRRVVPANKPAIVTELGGKTATDVRRSGSFFDPVMNLFLFQAGEVLEISQATWQEKECIRVAFRNTDLALDSAAYIEVKTMRLLARVDQLEGESQRTLNYSEHRRIAGLIEPLITTTTVEGQFDNRVIIEDRAYNIGTIPSLFAPEETEQADGE